MLNIENTRNYLKAFDFKTLLIEELGWANPTNKKAIPFQVEEDSFYRTAIAQLSGAIVYEITNDEGTIADAKTRQAISTTIQKLNYEHILIFVDKHRTQSVWRWVKKEDKKTHSREHFFSQGQTGDLFISKLASLFVDLSEIENDITITDVAKKIKLALDVERVTKKFFYDYEGQYLVFLELIKGIDNEADRRWYASVILNRLMFIYFLQKKFFLDDGNSYYLTDKLKFSKKEFGRDKFYSDFLNKLFFEGFAKDAAERSAATNKLIGKIKYLNGGLFLKHKIERNYSNISIPDKAFENLFTLFDTYSWTLDDTPGGHDDEINPSVLGYIFEKYINQKAFGAYYTRTEITEYLCEQTVYKLILDAVNDPEILLQDTKHLDERTQQLLKSKRYESVSELLINLDAETCKKLIIGDRAILPNLSLLDPACGSGAFLVAAMKTLINVYAAILGKINFLGDRKLIEWKKQIEQDHPSINYYIKKQIITNNLYGVDLMEEATEIAKLRLFLALVASAQTVDQLEPLPNIDFNIMNGNSLIGLLRVDANKFNKHFQQPTGKQKKASVVQKATLFNAATAQANLFAGEHAKSYQQLINEKEAAINAYKNAHETGITNLQEIRDSIKESEAKANEILNQLLEEEFVSLGIKYEQVLWDDTKNKEGKTFKRNISQADITALEPFHWGYEFSEIFRKKDGFDAIIANPPWEIFKPTAKEYFKEYSEIPIQRKMRIEDFSTEKEVLLKDKKIRESWLKYLSKFPYASEYYRKSANYKHQTSIISGKKSGSDINLYKLFLEQSFHLLKPGGRCGIIVPSGIYLDAGNKELRSLLFNKCQIENLYGISNEKFLFEEVEHNIKYTLLSFSKGGQTKNFNACFRINPREAVSAKDLDYFFSDNSKHISLSFDIIKNISPISLAIPEIKNYLELNLLMKIAKNPILGDKILKLGNEFHMTNDADIFSKNKVDKNYFPLVEGKMVHQYKYLYAQPRYWVKENEGRKRLLGRNEDENQILSYQRFRICFRAIARATDSRTMIATILPPNTFTSNSLAIVSNDVDISIQLFYVGILNSMTVDFILRSRISSNLNFFYVYNLAIPEIKTTNPLFRLIVEKSFKLICNTDEFSELAKKGLKEKWLEIHDPINENDQKNLRAEIEALVAHLYFLTEEEFSYVLSTFPVVAQTQKDAALLSYKKLASQLKEGSKQEEQLATLIQSGETNKIEFKSTLRVDLKTSKPEKFIEHSVLKTLAAFLNSDGGILLIGVDDDKNILGLKGDFNSFNKPDKLDEFQKHFDNLISKSLGNRFHRYMQVEFPKQGDKTVCIVTIKEKSSEPVYIINEAGQESFYIRRQASTIELKLSEALTYIKEHWR